MSTSKSDSTQTEEPTRVSKAPKAKYYTYDEVVQEEVICWKCGSRTVISPDVYSFRCHNCGTKINLAPTIYDDYDDDDDPICIPLCIPCCII
jgi:hypothetical protein